MIGTGKNAIVEEPTLKGAQGDAKAHETFNSDQKDSLHIILKCAKNNNKDFTLDKLNLFLTMME